MFDISIVNCRVYIAIEWNVTLFIYLSEFVDDNDCKLHGS